MRNCKSLLNKIKKLNKQIDITEPKDTTVYDLENLIDRYDDLRIKDSFRILYPVVASHIDAGIMEIPGEITPENNKFEKLRYTKRCQEEIFRPAFERLFPPKKLTDRYTPELINKAFNALYPEKENKPMPEVENKNKVMNDYIRKQAGMEEIPEDENKQEDNKKADMNELIRNSRKSTTQELRDIFFKRSE